MTEVIDQQVKNKSRKPLIIMLAVSLFPLMGAYFVYFTGFMMPSNTVNTGYFISPTAPIQPILNTEEWQVIVSDKKWRLIIPVPYPCNESCEANLYTSRQVHIRLDQKSKRLKRMAILSSGFTQEARKKLQEAHPRLAFIEATLESKKLWFDSLVKPAALSTDYYLLIDQEGQVMMAYDEKHHGNDVLKDLKRAIKFSIDYQ